MALVTVGNENGESNVANIFIKLIPQNKRKRTTGEMKEYTRTLLAQYENTLHPKVNDYSMGGSDEQPFNLMLVGDDLDQLSKVADGLLPKIRNIAGLVDINSNYKPGKPEYQVKFDPLRMERLGVQSVAAGMELRGMVEGMLPAKYRENGLEYDILVRLKEDQRDLSNSFGQLYVPNVNMQLVKLKSVADPVDTTGPTKIYRRNRK
jgi:HAE1 family hydrophobic/amphiphilic exporter-1